MTHIYRRGSRYEAAFDKERCAASVPMGGRMTGFHQCLRDNRKGKLIPDKDGNLWCKQHHPDTVKAKRDAADKKFADKQSRKQKRWDREAAEKSFCAGVSTGFLKKTSLQDLLEIIGVDDE